MLKELAKVSDLQGPIFRRIMDQINQHAARLGLAQYTTYSRTWEYPWLWLQLQGLKGQDLRVVDVGSEQSPFPWFLAANGFHVAVSDVTPAHWPAWGAARRRLPARISRLIVGPRDLDLPTGSMDIYLSVSVIEHMADKAQALAVAARVLRPGGLLIMTFDVCEAEMGMSFPAWNGRALSMGELDALFRDSAWFERGIAELPWNTEDIVEYLAWHRTTAPHHTYVTGAALVRRNERPWPDSPWMRPFRAARRTGRTVLAVGSWYLRRGIGSLRAAATEPVKSVVRRGEALLTSPRAATLLGEPFFALLGLRRAPIEQTLAAAKRILVVRLDEIGDAAMTTPFLRELPRNAPGAWISLVVKPEVFNLVERCPYVDEVLTFDRNTPLRLGRLRRHGRALRLARRHLWRRRFDLAIVPRWDADHYHAAFVAYFSGARARVAYSEHVTAVRRRLNRGYDRLFTRPLKDDTPRHEVERSLEVLRALGGTVADDRLELWVGPEDEAYADDVLRRHRPAPGDLLVGLGPAGGNSPLKQWPVDRFIELGRRLLAASPARLLVVGGPGEEALGEEMARVLGPPAINLVGRTTLRQMAAVLRRCRLYVGNDAGPMHVAAAVGTPVVAVFGSSCRHRYIPWGEGHTVVGLDLPCGPCFRPDHPDRCGTCIFDRPHCLLDLSVDRVQQAVEAALEQPARSAAGAVPRRGEALR